MKKTSVSLPVLVLLVSFYFSPGAKPVQAAAPTAGLIAHWKFNQTSGSQAFDSSGSNYTGTLVNNPVWVAGKVQNALQFNATDNSSDNDDPHVRLGTSFNVSLPFSISAWVKPADYSDYRAIFSKRNSYSPSGMRFDWTLLIGTGNVSIGQSGSSQTFNYSPPTNTWTHLTVILTSSATILYVNGVQQQSLGPVSLGNEDTANTVIGGTGEGTNGDNDPFKGEIDEMRVYSRALSSQETLDVYNDFAPDDQAPSAPAGLAATAVSASQINLAWNASTDDVGVAGYRVFRDGAEIGTSSVTSFSSTGLTPGTTYSYSVSAHDAAGNQSALSASDSATTFNIDASPPLISTVAASNMTANSVTITWTTNEPADTQVQYGLTQSYGSQTTLDSSLVTSHSQALSGLAANTTYNYRVLSRDAVNNTGASANFTFTTDGPPPGDITSGLVNRWSFDEGFGTTAVDSAGPYPGTLINGPVWTAGKIGNALQFNATDNSSDNDDPRVRLGASFNVSLPFSISAWVKPADYSDYRAIFSKRDSYSASGMRFDWDLLIGTGNVSIGQSGSSQTFNYSPPTNTWTHLTVILTSSATILYVNGVQQQSLGPISLGNEDTANAVIGGTGEGTNGDNDPFRGAIDDVRVYNRALADMDVQALFKFIGEPPDTTAPAISAVDASNITLSSATITWTSDEISDSQVQYGLTSSYGSATTLNPAPVTAHLQGLSGLQAGVTYHYRVLSKDPSGNSAASVNFTFMTPTPAPAPDASAPSTPANLSATAVSSSQINLSWTASSDNVGVSGYHVESCAGSSCIDFRQIGAPAGTTYSHTGLTASTTYRYRVRAADAAGNLSGYSNIAAAAPEASQLYGLEWPGDGAVRRMLYWHNPFPIYDATYVFKVFPREKTKGQYHYYTTFFWGNDGRFDWDNGNNPNTYYGGHPYPIPAPSGPAQWEVSVASNDFVTNSEVQWDRWYTQAFRAWRESPSITHHEFYWDLPDLSKVIRHTVVDPDWARENPPVPSIHIGQAAWDSYEGDEEFNGIIRGIQIYSGLLSVADIQAEIASPKSTTAGQNLIWYLNLNPRPDDVTDKKETGAAHNPSWRGTTAFEWTGTGTMAAVATEATSVDDTAPTISEVAASKVTSTSAHITWATDEASDTQVEYGFNQSYGSQVTLIPRETYHAQTLPGLIPGATYNYRVKSQDTAGNVSISPNLTFTTASAPLLPAAAVNLTATSVSTSGIDLSWTVPGDAAAVAGYKVYRSGTHVGTTSGTSFSDTGLTAGSTHAYTVSAIDAAGNEFGHSENVIATTRKMGT